MSCNMHLPQRLDYFLGTYIYVTCIERVNNGKKKANFYIHLIKRNKKVLARNKGYNDKFMRNERYDDKLIWEKKYSANFEKVSGSTG